MPGVSSRAPVSGMYGIGKINLKFKPIKKRRFPFGALFFFLTIFGYFLVFLYHRSWGRYYFVLPGFQTMFSLMGTLRYALTPTDYRIRAFSQEDVTITRDKNGIPFIKAKSFADAIFAQGYNHAADHLYLMDMRRRIAQGRLSEVVGQSGVFSDRIARLLNLEEKSRRDFAAEHIDDADILKAYAMGVNSFIGSRWVLPLDFILTARFTVEFWAPEDSLLLMKLLEVQRVLDWDRESIKLFSNNSIQNEIIDELFDAYNGAGDSESTTGLNDFSVYASVNENSHAWIDRDEGSGNSIIAASISDEVW